MWAKKWDTTSQRLFELSRFWTLLKSTSRAWFLTMLPNFADLWKSTTHSVRLTDCEINKNLTMQSVIYYGYYWWSTKHVWLRLKLYIGKEAQARASVVIGRWKKERGNTTCCVCERDRYTRMHRKMAAAPIPPVHSGHSVRVCTKLTFFEKLWYSVLKWCHLVRKKLKKKLPELDRTILDGANCCQSFKINPI